jgi:hypothetical protein
MRTLARVAIWVVVLLACAGVGAFIASRSNPFPPGVPDPGASSPSRSPESNEPAARWTLGMVSRTTHTFRVGGSCKSNWRMRTRISVDDDGRVRGRGTARLLPGATCDFPSAQVQTERVAMKVAGARDGDELRLRFRETDRSPVGSQDLGAFLKLLPRMRMAVGERAGAAGSRPWRLEDPEDEIYAAVTSVRLS